jgi:hypothetical protein
LKPQIRWWLAGFAMIGILAFLGFRSLCDAFGPMERHDSQCLICHRERTEKWLSGKKVIDEVTSNQYSDWVDTFVPSTHGHQWMGHTFYSRPRWFGATTIGCGGVAVIPRIFEQRNILGEQNARQIHARWRAVVGAPKVGPTDSRAMDEFAKAIVNDPESLLSIP